LVGCGSDKDSTDVEIPTDAAAPPSVEVPTDAAVSTTVLDLDDVKANPEAYEWFDFRPNVKKLILAGAEDTEHVAILWYTIADGSVGLHYHSQTESVFVIDGTQTDAKGTYPTGTIYFNPPGSGHQISRSTGFFILAYASPPDFASTDQIGEYTPVRIDTTATDFMSAQPFESAGTGVRTFAPPLDGMGGLSARFIELAEAGGVFTYQGNYLLVLDGSCGIDGAASPTNTLVVSKAITPRAFEITLSESGPCLLLGLSF
jgi:ChrR-like protein with cupin domain